MGRAENVMKWKVKGWVVGYICMHLKREHSTHSAALAPEGERLRPPRLCARPLECDLRSHSRRRSPTESRRGVPTAVSRAGTTVASQTTLLPEGEVGTAQVAWTAATGSRTGATEGWAVLAVEEGLVLQEAVCAQVARTAATGSTGAGGARRPAPVSLVVEERLTTGTRAIAKAEAGSSTSVARAMWEPG